MTDFPSRTELFDVMANDLLTRAELRPVGDRITPEQVYTPGSDINLICAGASAMGEEIVRANSRNVGDLTLEGASGDALDRLVADRYSPEIVKKTASQAVVELQFTRTSVAAGAVTYNSGSIVQSTGGIRFELLEDAAFGALSLGPVTVEAEAVDAGSSGNAAENTITSFVSTPPDTTMLVTNPETAAGGNPTETDEQLKSRARSYYKQARRGTKEAIEFGALTVPGIVQATAQELLDSIGTPSGFIVLYVADSNGQSNQILNQRVSDALLDYAGCGVVVTVYGAVPTYQSIILDLSYLSGINTSNAFDLVRKTVVARVNALAPGDTLHRSLIIDAARSVTGVIVADDAIVVPTGDVVPSSGQVLRTRSDLVTQSV